MLFGKFTKDWMALSKENLILKSVLITLSVALVICLLIIFKKNEKVIVTPAVITKGFVAEADYVEGSYKEQMALFFANFVGNLTAKNAGYVLDTMKKYFTPEAYANFRDDFVEMKLLIERNDYVYVFYPLRVFYDQKNNKYTVNGQRMLFNGKKMLSQEEVFYEIGFTYENWTLRITSLDLFSKDEYRSRKR